ncbi:transposase family protein [Capnocytophaga ochracea]|uniref:Transposase n=1 Tax=Capnocytophaga ochracea TaxID=1018 RepID=A0A2X2STJ7_CAPOC|nr:transposase family protein [Capnocytophaga ochracea]SQA95214.1 Transposase [Capnocytophaga ochracea]
MTLIEMLSSIEDTRKRRGIRHKMPNFLIMCLTAIMSGYTGYREIGRFLKENQWEFKKYLTFCKVPTYGSIRRIFMEIDFDDFAQNSISGLPNFYQCVKVKHLLLMEKLLQELLKTLKITIRILFH